MRVHLIGGVGLFPNERYEYILKKIDKHNSVVVSDLMSELTVSIETVRRDLFALEKEGKLKRIHGGAISIPKTKDFLMLEKRLSENKTQKDELSQKAMQFIKEGDIISIDSGSTSISFANALKEHFKSLKIITYSTEVVNVLSDCENYKIISTGGMFLASEKAFYGSVSTEALRNLHFAKSFIFPSAISIKNGVQDFCYEVVDMQKLLIENGDQIFFLADSSKLEKTATITLSKLSSNHTIITDNNVSETLRKLYKENNINMI